PMHSRHCARGSRTRRAGPAIGRLGARNVVTLPVVELLPVIWPRSFRNVCCCATAGPASSASTAARVIVLIVRSSRLANEDRCDLKCFSKQWLGRLRLREIQGRVLINRPAVSAFAQ